MTATPDSSATDAAAVPMLLKAIDVVNGVVDAVPADAWHAASPCTGWSALDVLSHITGTLGKVSEMISGDAYAGVAAQPSDDATLQAWHDAVAQVREQLPDADLSRMVESPRGPASVASALRLPTADLSVHQWDIAASAGLPGELPDDLLQLTRDVIDAVPEPALRSPGLFGPEVAAADNASPTDKLMAWLGRSRPQQS